MSISFNRRSPNLLYETNQICELVPCLQGILPFIYCVLMEKLGEEFENIEFKPIDSGLGFHAPPSPLLPPPKVEEFKEKQTPLRLNTYPRSWLRSFWPAFYDQLFILLIFGVLCLAPFFQFQLFKNPEKVFFLFQKSILVSFAILLCVVEAFYYLFFKQFKLPRFGKWITESKLSPQRH